VVDSLRSGGFGSPFLGYGNRQGGFSQYRIGNDSGEDLAYLDKLAAQTAWQNGQISDGAYLSALREYVNATDKGSSSRISAENQLRDAEYNIGRNELVLRINAASTPSSRIAALTRLIGYERRWRATMTSDNEQAREMNDSIRGLQQQVRSTRWGEMVRKYNNDQLSDARMQAYARQMAQQASGQPDEQTYRDYVTDFGNRILDDKINDAIERWNKTFAAGDAKNVESLYANRMARMNKQSPAYEAQQEALERFREAVVQQRRTKEYEITRSQYEAGVIGDYDWLDFLRTRVTQEKPGSVERIRARDAFIATSFDLADRSLNQQVQEGTRSVTDLIDFYQSSLATMDHDSSRAKELLAKVAELRATGLEQLDISSSAGASRSGIPAGSGHYVSPGLAPDGDGYISQHDGSDFAKTNCGMAASAMLAWDVSGGKVKVSGGDMRYYSGDQSGGTWTDGMVRAMAAVGLGAREFHGLSFSTFRNRIQNGKPAVLTGSNSMLPAALRNGYDGEHAIFVARVQTTKDGKVWYWVMDPNARSAAQGGRWWPESALHAFGWEGAYRGSAVFAGKSGNATVSNTRELPPFQAFDTDYNGNSTLGRGGGASRAEAGARQDWSKGKKTWKLERAAGGAAAVEDFLSAVSAIEGNLSPEQVAELEDEGPEVGGSDIERTQRAARILARNGNDPRLAAVEWFTGRSPELDAGEWSKTDRWYANGVARKLDLEKITPETVLSPDAPKTAPGGKAPEELDATDDIITGLDPDLETVARGLLKRLGVPPSQSNIQSVGAWIAAESGDKVEGHNPLRLLTPGEEDLDGQYGKTEDGMALFDSLEAGLDATAALIPQEIVAALRGNDPEAFVRALEQTEWSPDPLYSSHVARTYNTLPGDTPIIVRTGPRPFTAPTSLSVLARTHPELEELLDVDPADPVQMAWFTENMERAREAALRGDETFMFTPPGTNVVSGAIAVPISPQAAKDILRVNYDYAIMAAPVDPSRHQVITEAAEAYTQMSGEIDMEMARSYFDESRRDRDVAMLQGDYTTAFNIELQMTRFVNATLGQGPDETPDIARAPEWMGDDDRAYLTGVIDSLVPQSSDPNAPEALATSGSPLMAMYREGKLHVERQPTMSFAGTMVPGGYAAAVTLDPGEAFLTVDPKGNVAMHTRANDPEMFAEVTEVLPDGTLAPPIPRYQSMKHSGMVRVTVNGMTSYQPLGQVTLPFIELYDYEDTGRTRDINRQNDQQRSDLGNITNPDHLGNLLDLLGQGASLMGGSMSGAPTTTDEPVQRTAAPVRQEERLLQPVGVLTPGEANHPTIYQLEMYDHPSGETVTWISLDQVTWIGWMGDRLGKGAPGFVAQNGATWQRDPANPSAAPVLTVAGAAYDPNTHGSIGQYLVPYGLGNTPPPAGQRGVGAPNGDYYVRQVAIDVQDGSVGLAETDLSLTPIERWKGGGIATYSEAARQQQAMDPVAWEANKMDEAAIKRILNESAAPRPRTVLQGQQAILLSLPGGAMLNRETHSSAATARVGARQVLLEEQRARVEAARQQQAQADRIAATRAAAPRPKATPTPAPTAPQPTPQPTIRGTTPTPKPSPTPVPVVKPQAPQGRTTYLDGGR
jgi:hypothetical protein